MESEFHNASVAQYLADSGEVPPVQSLHLAGSRFS
jgi:hypothetical protein